MLELVISGRTIPHHPSDMEVNEAVQAVLDGREEFVILENRTLGVTLQLAIAPDTTPHLEFIEDPPGLPISAVTETVTPTDIKRAFLYLVHNDSRWQHVIVWADALSNLRHPAGNGSPALGVAVVVAVILALVVLALLVR